MQPHLKRAVYSIAVLALALIFYGVFGRNTLLLSLENDTVTLTGPESSSYAVPHPAISSMELRESFEPGAAVDGGVKNRIRYGTWQNEEFGAYQLFASEKIRPVIVLRTKGGDTLVFNYESEKTTRSFFATFTAYLSEAGYLTGD